MSIFVYSDQNLGFFRNSKWEGTEDTSAKSVMDNLIPGEDWEPKWVAGDGACFF